MKETVLIVEITVRHEDNIKPENLGIALGNPDFYNGECELPGDEAYMNHYDLVGVKQK